MMVAQPGGRFVVTNIPLRLLIRTAFQLQDDQIGVRMALGAAPARIFRLVVGHGLRLSAVGVTAGLLAAFVLTHAMAGMLVDVQPTDPATLATVVLLFFAVVAVAAWLPARRAAGLDPIALQED